MVEEEEASVVAAAAAAVRLRLDDPKRLDMIVLLFYSTKPNLLDIRVQCTELSMYNVWYNKAWYGKRLHFFSLNEFQIQWLRGAARPKNWPTYPQI